MREVVEARLPGWKLVADLGSDPDFGYLVEVSKWVGPVLTFRKVWFKDEKLVWDVTIREDGYVLDPEGVRVGIT